MAQLKQRRPENIAGDFFVDSTCIDCDTCRWVAPKVFKEHNEQSIVYHQPANEEERTTAMQALLSCPTASIGTVDKPTNIKVIQQSFPIPIAENVYYCGYHSEKSYGAASYLIQREEGNILIDSPRFAAPLAKRLEEMGGVKYLYLTHRDDVADHRKFHEHFQCDRLLHRDDITSSTADVEIKLSGNETIEFASDISIIPVPGHSKGHTVLLYNQKFLFTGDHLAWSEYLQHLYAFRDFCGYSWEEQIKSMEKLASFSFEWVLPGHGRRYSSDRQTMATMMAKCLTWMKGKS